MSKTLKYIYFTSLILVDISVFHRVTKGLDLSNPVFTLTNDYPPYKEKPQYFYKILPNTTINESRHLYEFFNLNMWNYLLDIPYTYNYLTIFLLGIPYLIQVVYLTCPSE